MSDISLRSRKPRRFLSLLLLAVFLPCAGCPASPKKVVLVPADEKLLLAKADEQLKTTVQAGGGDRFAAIGVFRDDVFLNHAAALEQASIPILGELGKAAILLLSPGQVLPLLKDPSIRALRWLGPQGRLAHLDPSLEMDLLVLYGKGSEGKDVSILARFKDVPGEKEERQATAAGFRVVTRAGPTWVVAGPMSGLPKLLEGDRIIYIEKAPLADNTTGTGRVGVTVTKEVPHSRETIPEIRDREMTNPLPARGDTAIHSHKIPRAGIDNGMSIRPSGDNTVR